MKVIIPLAQTRHGKQLKQVYTDRWMLFVRIKQIVKRHEQRYHFEPNLLHDENIPGVEICRINTDC